LLVVDDEESILAAMRAYFSSAGFTVDCARSLGEATQLLARESYACVVTDVMLSGGGSKDGVVLLELVRGRQLPTRVVLLTAFASAETASNAKRQGVDAFLSKPIALRELQAVIERLVEGMGAVDAIRIPNGVDDSIAVVGIGVRVPGARRPSEFWTNLRDGVDSITEVPRSRFDVDRIYDPIGGVPGKISSRWGGFIDRVDAFDAAFFGISPREAIRMDPQQRLALEVAWEALDDGGQRPLGLRGTPTGVFIGVHRDEYGRRVEARPSEIDLLSATGGSRSGVAGRISYALGLEGPSLVFDTDRSSSLVAVHAACQSLKRGECSIALAGGVNLVLTPDLSLAFSRAKMLAPDGRIKFCDARADGIVRSDGIGIVVLKPLGAALRDRDPIYALILGSAINHEGGRSGDLLTPSRRSQSALLRAACEDARVSPHDIQYVEAHGTGTIVGDPIEVEALAEVMQRGRSSATPLRIGSVKTNIGHTEAAAGIAGLIKVALAMKHRLLPASLHFLAPNPRIAFDGVVVQQKTTPWPDETRPLVAGVTSLGLTGVNAHVVLQEAPPRPLRSTIEPARAEILALSARGGSALLALGADYVRSLRESADSPFDIARWAATRRSHLEDRVAVVGESVEALARALEAALEGVAARASAEVRGRPKIAFVFPGECAEPLRQKDELLDGFPAFRASMERCDAAIREIAGDGALGTGSSLAALEISLAAQWRAWRIEPDMVFGTGVGEVAAAHVAGVLSLEDAMRIACRGPNLDRELVNLAPSKPRIPMRSTIEALLSEDPAVFLEVSPHPLLLGPLADRLGARSKATLLFESLHHGEPARRTLFATVAALYTRGFDIDWERLFAEGGRAVDLPAYAWQRDRFWFASEEPPSDPTPSRSLADASAGATPRETGERARALVKREVKEVLGLPNDDAIDPRRGFRELGLSSLMSMELLSRLERALPGRALPSSILFNHPNVEALAAYLSGEPSATSSEHRESSAPSKEPIAVVGMACRFPGGARDPDAFWRCLHEGVDAIGEVPANRWDVDRWYDPAPQKPGKMCTRWGGFLEDIAGFDAAFFGISPREAEEMDPQHRLLLEVAWEALERAGQAPDELAGRKGGVFFGLMNNNDYVALKRLLDDPTRIRAHHSTGMATSVAAGRVAYLLGLTGPALSVDTACSSSLVAVHLAIESLRRGECSMALAGGVNAILSPELSVAYSQAGMLSRTGRCKTFDASADGYVRSEGCGVLVLKRLSDALEGGDRVLAVLPGAAVNQDGRTSGLTAPNGEAQSAVIRAALADAGLTPADVDYVEAHGTGTNLGDPIEFHALGELFQEWRSAGRPVFVGSVKTNIGHLEAAAGVAGLIKAILAIQHREIPPHLHLQTPNPRLGAERYPLHIPTRPTPWPESGRRIAGVSSFGFSGTNAHIIVTEAPREASSPRGPRAFEIIPLSARTERALVALAEAHAAHLLEHPEIALGDVAHTLANGRAHHDLRYAVVAGTRSELIESLKDVAEAKKRASVQKASPKKLAWMFTGQGAQRLGMGRELAAEWPVFKRALEEACDLLDAHLERPIAEVMWAEPGTPDAAHLDETGFTQPALFAIAVALSALWRSWGAHPDLVIGHSVGELAAAHIAGVFSLEDAARLIATRARLMQALPPGGAMVSIAASEADVFAAVSPHARTVAIAGVNGPASVVISGDERETLAIAETFARRGIRTTRLRVSCAFHSPRMDPMLDAFRAAAETVRYRAPEVRGVGNVDGAFWGSDVATADYWVRQIRATVRFADGLATLHQAGVRAFLEIGPKPTLMPMVRTTLPDEGQLVLATMRADGSERRAALEALSSWYEGGGTVDWSQLSLGQVRPVELPTYPWERQRHWIAHPPAHRPDERAQGGALLRRIPIASGDTVVATELSLDRQPWLLDHRVGGEVVVPATAMLALLQAASEDAVRATDLSAITLFAPLRIGERESREVQVVFSASKEPMRVALYSRASPSASWAAHVEAEAHRAAPSAIDSVDLASLRAQCADRVDVDATYDALAALGLSYGPMFRGLRELWRGPDAAMARVVVPDPWAANALGTYPALLDAALQATIAGANDLHLPFAFERVRMLEPAPSEAWVFVKYTTLRGQEMLGADVTIADESGRLFATLLGFRAKRTRLQAFGLDARTADALFRVSFRPSDASPASLGSERWVIVGNADEAGLAGRIHAKLSALGVRSKHVDWTRTQEARPAEHVVCVWEDEPNEDAPSAALERVGQGLEIAKVLIEEGPAPRVWWMTRGARRVDLAEHPSIAASSLWGLGRTLMLEHPELRCRLVDLPRREASAVDDAIAELAISDTESEVAWRGGRRFVARLLRATSGGDGARPLRTDGTVLVTGGLGGIGQHIGRWLARRGTKHIVLAGRRGDRTPGALELADELRRLGSSVTIARLDVRDRDAVAAVLSAIPGDAPLRGVVHAAGTLDDRLLVAHADAHLSAHADAHLSAHADARLAEVMGAKTVGAWHLDALTRDLDLDAFVMFSSVAGAFGSRGQATYAAANAFLDGLAAHRRALGLPAMSLAWGPWAGVGMTAALDPSQRRRWEAKGMQLLSPPRALALLDAALDHADAELVAVPLDLAEVRRSFDGSVPSVWRALLPAHEAGGVRFPAMPPARRRDAMLDLVRTEAARALSLHGPDAVDSDRPLSDLGLDSLLALELRIALGQRLGTSLPTTLAFDHPTPTALADYLTKTAPEPAAHMATPEPVIEARGSGALIASGEQAASGEPIAIVGLGMRFPGGANDPDSFWRLLADGVDAIREVPKERWDVDAYYDPNPGQAGKMYTREGGFLTELDRFDAEFFEISPREAVNMDPQQRLLLETTWEALERAGIAPGALLGTNAGVFVGVMSHEYLELQGPDLERRDGYVTTGSLGSVASGRISYVLGVHGPSMTIDTACSSSLVAAHLACQALRSGECDLAITGGATVVLTPSLFVEFSRLRGLSRDGRCKSFASAADGVAWSEGCGVLVLKRLSDAERDRDPILALIVGSAVNQDGRSQGLTAPNGSAQQEVIKRALREAKVSPAAVDYVEAHGTGTRLGDPIEMLALGGVLEQGRDPHHPVVVGSLKSNIGHAQAAAGVGGIIKTVLALEHESIPRSLHFDEPSPHIPWSRLPVKIATESMPWKRRPDRARIAGVSSFGISGTNAHLLLAEAPARPTETKAPPRIAELLLISAQHEVALEEAAGRLAAHLSAHADVELDEVAATLGIGRTHHRHRLSIVARTRDEALTALEAAAKGRPLPSSARRSLVKGTSEKLAWLFTGQGAQSPNMGRALTAAWPRFAEELERVSSAFDVHLDRPLRAVMWDDGARLLDQTAYTQPALFALEVALAALWRSWGVVPDILIGHSIGELAAAYVAGVFTLDDAARLVASRARLMQALPEGGAMVSVAADEETVANAIASDSDVVSIAAVNGPRSVVISGAGGAVGRIVERFAARGVRTWRLTVSHAFHSPLIDPMLDDFKRVAESIEYRRPTCPFVSNVSGAVAGDEIMNAAYWVQHARRAVRFADGVKAAHAAGARRFLEIGPRPTLVGLVPACVSSDELTLLSSLRPGQETEAVLEGLGALHVRGASIDWQSVFPKRARCVDLPTYPWQRKSYWLEPHREQPARAPGMTSIDHPLLRGAITRPDGGEHVFTAELSLRETPWLLDHRIHETAVFPGTAFLELALAVGQRVGMNELLELTLVAPLPLSDQGSVPVQIWVHSPDADGRRALTLYAETASDERWICHARGRLGRSTSPGHATAHAPWPPKGARAIDLSGLYDRLAENGFHYGAAFRGMNALWRDGDDLYVRVELPEALHDAGSYLVHPALLDASLHALPLSFTSPEGVLLPFEWRFAELSTHGATSLMVHLRITEHGDDRLRASLDARNADGESVLRVKELFLRRASADKMRVRSACLHRVEWDPIALEPPRTFLRAIVVGGSGALAARLSVPHVADLEALHDMEPSAQLIVDATSTAGPDVLTEAHRNTHDALSTLQTLLSKPRPAGWELVWMTEGAIAATSDDRTADLAHAPLWGMVRCARREVPHLSLRLIDIEADSARPQILGALTMRTEPELAIRGATILASRLRVARAASTRKTWRTDREGQAKRAAAEGCGGGREDSLRANSEGTVLITGATGALGALVARHLIRRYGVRRLLLTSARGEAAPGARALCDDLYSMGALVTLAACDVSDRSALVKLFERIPPNAPLRAVFHCAGAVDDGLVSALTAARVDRVFRPKLDAAVHLHELTRALPLDAFVLFSSVSGIVGTAGQANYAAANTFLDALAVHRSRAGLAGQSLAWGLWAPSSQGMSAKLSGSDLARLGRQGIAPLSSEEGLELLDEALARSEPLLVPARLDLERARPRLHRLDGLDEETSIERRQALPELVRAEVAAVFRQSNQAISDDVPLKNQGLDSVMAVELCERLGSKLEIMLPATLAFDHPTVREIAGFVEKMLGKNGEARSAPTSSDEEAAVRRALATVPLDVLREKGILNSLLQIAKGEPAGVGTPNDIEKLSNEELVTLVNNF
jgi:polyene macrolide polyketide synthase/mycolactone side chain polyketide synthase